jgi:flagellar motor component MotA
MDWIYIAGIVIIGFIIIKWAGSFFIKLLGFLLFVGLIAAALYYFEVGPFKNMRSVNLMEERFCKNPAPNSFKCECIVELIDEDLNKRYSAEELKELEKDTWKMGIVVIKSFNAQKSQIKACLKEHDAEHELDEFVKEVMVLNKDKGEDMLHQIKGFLKDKIDDLDELWDDVEDRYKD